AGDAPVRAGQHTLHLQSAGRRLGETSRRQRRGGSDAGSLAPPCPRHSIWAQKLANQNGGLEKRRANCLMNHSSQHSNWPGLTNSRLAAFEAIIEDILAS